jgi:hypothetical protein
MVVMVDALLGIGGPLATSDEHVEHVGWILIQPDPDTTRRQVRLSPKLVPSPEPSGAESGSGFTTNDVWSRGSTASSPSDAFGPSGPVMACSEDILFDWCPSRFIQWTVSCHRRDNLDRQQLRTFGSGTTPESIDIWRLP